MRKPGIYIDLPEEDYFAERNTIGGSGLKDLIPERIIEFWWSSTHNPVIQTMLENAEDKPERKDGKMFGKALHKGVLEGLEKFKDSYALEFDAADHPEAIDTMNDMKSWIRNWNERTGGKIRLTGNKGDLAQSIFEADPSVPLLQSIKNDYDTKNFGKTYIKRTWYDYILLFSKITSIDPYISALTSEGVPELSVFWEEGGVPCRMRLDWFRKTETVEVNGQQRLLTTADLKSFSPWSGRSIKSACLSNIKKYRYDLQEAHYRAGINAMADLPIHGGTEEQRQYITEALKQKDKEFIFLFYKSIGAPITKEARTPGTALSIAQSERDGCFQAWRQFADKFDYFNTPSRPWMVACDQLDIDDDDFGKYHGT